MSPSGAIEEKNDKSEVVNEEIEDEIEEEIISLELSDEKNDTEKIEKSPLISSKDKVIVDEIDMFSDNNYWKTNESLKNAEFIEELLSDYGK